MLRDFIDCVEEKNIGEKKVSFRVVLYILYILSRLYMKLVIWVLKFLVIMLDMELI